MCLGHVNFVLGHDPLIRRQLAHSTEIIISHVHIQVHNYDLIHVYRHVSMSMSMSMSMYMYIVIRANYRL